MTKLGFGSRPEALMHGGRRLLLALHAALFYGLVEWCVIGRDGLGLFQGEAARSLAAVILLYGGVGIACGALATIAQSRGAAPHSGWVLPLSVLLALAAFGDSESVFSLLGAGALFATLAVLGMRHGDSVHDAVRRLMPSVVAFGLAVSLVFTTLGARDSRRAAWALVAAVIVAGLGVASGISGRRERPILSGAPVILTFAVALGVGIGPPTADPDSTPSSRPALLLVTIDTLRADRVGAYGYAAARTPNFDALGQEGALFETVVAPTVWTGPAHASIFTGLVPERHGVLLNASRLDASVGTIVEPLRRAGFVTASFNGGYTTSESSLGLPGRFDFFDDDLRNLRWLPPRASGLILVRVATSALARLGVQTGYTWPLYRPAASIAEAAREWLVHNGNRPWFVWVHFFDPHLPYRPPADLVPEPGPGAENVSGRFYQLPAVDRMRIMLSPEATARMRQLYDAEIAYVDRELGRLLATAREVAPAAGLLTIVTADHGGAMGEHGLYWNRDLHDESLRVPLAITGPRIAPKTRRVADQVRLIDLAPTILELLDLDVPEGLDGKSLAPSLLGRGSLSSSAAISVVYQQSNEFHRNSVSVRLNDWKLIQSSEGWLGGRLGPVVAASQELYDLRQDPLELDNLASSRPEKLEELSMVLSNRARPDAVSTEALTPEQRRMLRSLGYIR